VNKPKTATVLNIPMNIKRALFGSMAVALIAMPLSIRADQLLVIDTANDRILVCDTDSHQVDVFADIDAFDVAQSTDGNLYASRTRSQKISKLDKAGKVLSDWTVPGNRFAYGLVYDNGAVWANVGDSPSALACFSEKDGQIQKTASWGNVSASMRGLVRSESLFYGVSFGNSMVKSLSDSLTQDPVWVEAKSARAVDVFISKSGERFVSYQGDGKDSPDKSNGPGVYSDISQSPVVTGFVPFGLAENNNSLYVSDIAGSIRIFDTSNGFAERDKIELPPGTRPGMLCILKGKKAP
jgi:hypothetical protein